MARYICYLLWRPPRRVVCRLRPAWYGSQPPRRHVSIQVNAGPVQSELFRFALAKTAHTEDLAPGPERPSTDIFLEEWPLNTSPTPLALEQCERRNTYGDILSFINGLDTRLERLNSWESGTIHFMGMHYACLAFSESSLEYHLRGYLTATRAPLGLVDSQRLVEGLLSSLRTLYFQDPMRDTSKLLRLVTGGGDPDTPNLHQIIYWTRDDATTPGLGNYLALLVQAKSETTRYEVWNRYLQRIIGDPEFTDFQQAYVYALSLVNAGDSSGSLTTLKQLSERARNDLPGISEFEGLRGLLEDDTISKELGHLASETEYARTLGVQISRIERRLGIKWESSEGVHEGISDTRPTSDQPILTMNGDSPGYDAPERLIEEIRALGCSKCPADLGKIADSLDEYEGTLIPISIPSWSEPNAEFYWAPQRSPVELRDNCSLEIENPQSISLLDIGLVKVIASREESPYALTRTLHLVQLGYLLAKQPPRPNERLDDSPQPQESGHLVTWDRVSGRFLIVFAGTGRGPVDPTTEFHILAAPSGHDSIVEATPRNNMETVGPEIRIPKYRLEQDQGLDLIFDIHT
ncbi:hypothetical protein BDW62DRAFT_207639 [Aspergillus aurantiobrunneus]